MENTPIDKYWQIVACGLLLWRGRNLMQKLETESKRPFTVFHHRGGGWKVIWVRGDRRVAPARALAVEPLWCRSVHRRQCWDTTVKTTWMTRLIVRSIPEAILDM